MLCNIMTNTVHKMNKCKETIDIISHIKFGNITAFSFGLTCISACLHWGGFSSWCSSCCHIDTVSWTWHQTRYLMAGNVDCLWVNSSCVVVGLNQVLVILLNVHRFWPVHFYRSSRDRVGYYILHWVWYWMNKQEKEELHYKSNNSNIFYINYFLIETYRCKTSYRQLCCLNFVFQQLLYKCGTKFLTWDQSALCYFLWSFLFGFHLPQV